MSHIPPRTPSTRSASTSSTRSTEPTSMGSSVKVGSGSKQSSVSEQQKNDQFHPNAQERETSAERKKSKLSKAASFLKSPTSAVRSLKTKQAKRKATLAAEKKEATYMQASVADRAQLTGEDLLAHFSRKGVDLPKGLQEHVKGLSDHYGSAKFRGISNFSHGMAHVMAFEAEQAFGRLNTKPDLRRAFQSALINFRDARPLTEAAKQELVHSCANIADQVLQAARPTID